MKQMSKTRMLLTQALNFILHPSSFIPGRRGIALANELAGRYARGIASFMVDANQSVPVTNSYIGGGKHLLWGVGTTTATAGYSVILSTGGAGAADRPFGISDDAPYQAGDLIDVRLLGAVPGTEVGISGAAITTGHLCYAMASGLIGDAQASTLSATVWIIGRALKTVSAAGMEVSFNPCLPYLLTSTAGTLTMPTNPL